MYLALAGILSAGLDGIIKGLELREDRHRHMEPALLPETIEKSLDCLEKDELLNREIPPALMKGYLALRRADAARTSKMTIEEQVQEALERA